MVISHGHRGLTTLTGKPNLNESLSRLPEGTASVRGCQPPVPCALHLHEVVTEKHSHCSRVLAPTQETTSRHSRSTVAAELQGSPCAGTPRGGCGPSERGAHSGQGRAGCGKRCRARGLERRLIFSSACVFRPGLEPRLSLSYTAAVTHVGREEKGPNEKDVRGGNGECGFTDTSPY